MNWYHITVDGTPKCRCSEQLGKFTADEVFAVSRGSCLYDDYDIAFNSARRLHADLGAKHDVKVVEGYCPAAAEDEEYAICSAVTIWL